jgi:prolipoprotein diacylglyceryltransferase
VFLAYVVGYSIFRFLVEFLRTDLKGTIGPISTTQILCLIALAVAPFLYHRLSRRPLALEAVAPGTKV